MIRTALRTACCTALLAAAALPAAARAETVNCTEIASLPATLTSQGVYCLKKDLATGLNSGNAITVATNNVTIDCNGYKIGGLMAGPATAATGIYADTRMNITVRGCNVRGFRSGIRLSGAGHLVEDNRLDGSTWFGIAVYGDASVIRGNRVFDTIGTSEPVGIFAGEGDIDVLDNLIANVGDEIAYQAKGIQAYQLAGGEVARNRIRGVASSYLPISLHAHSGIVFVNDNRVSGASDGWGVYCGVGYVVASGNQAVGLLDGIRTCLDGGGNFEINAP